MRRGVVAAACIVLALAGCQPSTPPPPPAAGAPVGSLTAQLRDEGDALTAKGDFEHAAVKYLAAVNQEPGNVALRYVLGVALSHLERRGDTVEQFRWVVAHGKPGSAEVEGARSWLASAGELGELATMTAPTVTLSGQDGQTPPPETSADTSRIKGKVDWGGIDPRDRLIHAQLTLVGEEPANRDVKRSRRARIGDVYEFRSLPPGKYRLTGEALDRELWDQMVTLEASKEATLDLTQQNSRVSPRDFPPKEEG